MCTFERHRGENGSALLHGAGLCSFAPLILVHRDSISVSLMESQVVARLLEIMLAHVIVGMDVLARWAYLS